MTVPAVPDLAARLAHLAAPGAPDAELLRRFADHGDGAAFELLVWRYAGLVFGTARRALGNAPDADDAFQAAFLALARRAATVRSGEALGGWLHRVALRAALKVRAARARRAAREGAPLPDRAARATPAPDDTAAVIDEELARLPEKLRVAFVLCELEGRADAEAAAQLGCPVGTVQSRLSRARERLRARLSRRGLAPLVGPLAVGAAAVPGALVRATAAGAVPFAAGAALEGTAPALARAVLRPGPLKPALGALALAALTVGAVLAAHAPTAPPVPPTVPIRAASDPPHKPAPPKPFQLDTAKAGLSQIDEVRFSPDGRWIVAAGSKPVGTTATAIVGVWRATGAFERALTEPEGVGAALAFSRDGKLCATANTSANSAALWDTATWKERRTFEHPLVSDVALSPDGARVATLSRAFAGTVALSEVRVHDAATGKALFAHRPAGKETFASVAFAPDGKAVAVGTSAGTVRVLDAATGKVRHELKVREAADNRAAFAPDGARVLTWTTGFEIVGGAASGGVRLWDAATGKLERTFGPNDHPVVDAAFTPNGRHVIATSTSSGIVWVWETGGKRVAEVQLSDTDGAEGGSVAVSPDGALLAVSGWEGKARRERPLTVLYDLPTGKERARLAGVRAVAFAPNGAALAALSGTGDGPDTVAVRPLIDVLK